MGIRYNNGEDEFPNTISEVEQEDEIIEYKSKSNSELPDYEETKSNNSVQNRYVTNLD